MAGETLLTAVTLQGTYPDVDNIVDADYEVDWEVGDNVLGNAWVAASPNTKWILEARNTHETVAKTITISSVGHANWLNRKGTVVISLTALQEYHYYFSSTNGFRDPANSNRVVVTPESADVEFRLWQLP